MADARRGLGRGLSALLGESDPPREEEGAGATASAGTPGPASMETPIELLRRNPDQPRRVFSEPELNELAESIRERGILQPILVRPAPGAPGEYQIVAGERRWRAAQKANLHTVPVIVRSFDDAEVAEIAVIENVQRADLNPLEEAQGYKLLMERFGRTQEAIAKTVGKSRSHIANMLRLLNLPNPVRELVEEGKLTAGHARAIAGAPDPSQLARAIVDGELSVRDAEALARKAQDKADTPRPRVSGGGGAASRQADKDADTHALEQDLSNLLGLEVAIADRQGVGEVRVRYTSLEQLDSICQRLSGGKL